MFAISSPKRIANKIILLVLSLELISVSLWGGLTYLSSERELLNTISSKLNESVIRISTDIGNFFDPLDAEVQAISNVIITLSINESQKTVLFSRLLNNRPEIEEISIVSKFNKEKIRISRMQGIGESDLRDMSHNKLIIRSRNNKKMGKVTSELSEITFSQYSEPQINVAFLLHNDDLILLKVNLKWLWDKVNEQKIGDTGFVYVLNDKKVLIAHRDPSYVLSGLSLSDTSIPKDFFSKSNKKKLEIYTSFTGQRVAGVANLDKSHNWWIVVEQPVTEGLAPLTRIVNQFITVFIAIAFLSVVIVVYFANRSMRPLVTLELGIAKLANGDRDVQIEVSGSSELSSLAESFNTMASSMDGYIAGMLQTQNNLENSRKELQNSEQRFLMLLNSAAEAIYGIDSEGKCTFCNPATLRYLGYESIRDVIGKPIDQVLTLKPTDNEKDSEKIKRIHQPELLGDGVHCYDVLICEINDLCFHAELHSHAIIENSSVIGAVVTFSDITERYTYQEALKYQAYHDSLTNLPNRKMLHDKIDEIIGSVSAHNSASLMLIDLDRFKDVNDALGHKSGDDLLKMLGPRLQKLLSVDDTIARLGGDEFAILLPSRNTIDEAVFFAQEVIDAITQPFDLEGMQIQIDASIGITLFPLHAADGSTLMRYADVAMYHAKTKGLGFAVYEKDLDSHSPRRLALLGELRNAIEDNQLVLYYQPKVRLNDKKITGFEALIRWQHPEYGLLYPDEFIPLAELGELINPLTFWVINQAIIDQKKWSSQGYEFNIAVNVSVRNLQDINIVSKVKQTLNDQEISSKHIEIEVTESAVMSDPVRAQEILQQLNDLGIHISMDDYGTGYSSLSYLKQLPISYLKIDKSFVIDMNANDNDTLIVRSTIKLAHNLGLKVIAEGVENEKTWGMLEQMGCDLAQGYFMSRPMPSEDVISWHSSWVNSAK